MKNYKEWTVFLDRDGVINKRAAKHDYIKSWEEFEFLPRSIDGIVLLSKIFGRVIIITNQQGISKGAIDPYSLETITYRMVDTISKNGGNIDLVLTCTHPESDNCECRKPKTGLAVKARKIFPEINFEKSVMIGDDKTDLEFGLGIGAFTVLIRNSRDGFSDCENMFDATFESLYEFSTHPLLFSEDWKRSRG